MRRPFVLARVVVAAWGAVSGAGVTACSADAAVRTPDAVSRPTLVAAPATEPTPKPADACADGADSVYVFDDQGRIQLFLPDGPVEQRFRVVATTDCPDDQPQTMSLDHDGVAWLLYSSGKLYRMKLPDGSCVATSYAHPGTGGVMGMTFTAAENGSKKERLYISDRSGLIEVELPSLKGRVVAPAVPVGELAGGPDGLVFHLDMASGMLAELDRRTFALRPVHAFGPTGGAFTLLRHRRGFFYFAAEPSAASHVYRWSPRAEATIDLGSAPEGVRVLGRAQSVCVDWSEAPGAASLEPKGVAPP